MAVLGWAYYALSQIVSGLFTVIGWVLLLPFCLLNAWSLDGISIKPLDDQQIAALKRANTWIPLSRGRRMITRWSWDWLNAIYGNPEDGVSGQEALLWDGDKLVVFMEREPRAWWRAYKWSALRNSTNNLKYVFQWRWTNPPYKEGTFNIFGKKISYAFGWKMENFKYYVPIFRFKPTVA